VLDDKGVELPVSQNYVEGVNINTDGEQKVREVLTRLFSEVQLQGKALGEYLGKAHVIAGMAGVALAEPRAKVRAIFEDLGAKNLELQGDAEMWLSGTKDPNAMVVICGTGHVIFGKVQGQLKDERNKFYRLGGWGADDGDDKPSGYNIGLAGIKAVRASQEEYGPKTVLEAHLRTHFGEENAQSIRTKVLKKEIPVAKVAEFAKVVFDHAAVDKTCGEIIERDFEAEISNRCRTFVTRHSLESATIHFVGSLMKTASADIAIRLTKMALQNSGQFTFVNDSSSNVAVEYTKNILVGEKQ
jgi:N-acetylglucosamine kinase-like BadF-type ATPase